LEQENACVPRGTHPTCGLRLAALVAAFAQVAVAVEVADGLVTLLRPSERFFRRP